VWSCSVPPEDASFKKKFVEEYQKSVSDDEARAKVEAAVSMALDDVDRYVFPWIRDCLI
jgi:hypothetical protein